MSEKSGGNFFMGLFLAVAIVVAAYIGAAALKDVKQSDQTFTVKGYTERKITSDYAVWQLSHTSYALDQVTAYNNLELNKVKILNFLKKYGIEENDVSFKPVYLNVIFRLNEQGYMTNIREGYSVSQTLEISSNDVNKISKIATESSELLKEGIEVNISSPQYYYTKIDDLKIEMLGDATKDAYNRAQEMASNSNSKVGTLRSAQQGVFQITPAMSTDVSDWGMNDVSSLEKSIKAVVTMQFTIK